MIKKVKYLVVDSGAFIKNSPIHEYAEHVFTVQAVVKEIKDSVTRQRLQFLPYELIIKEPSPENYKYVLEFSKKTGDYSSLSTTDLKVLALTFELEKEHVGIDHLNKEPACKVTDLRVKEEQFCGFYSPDEKKENDTAADASNEVEISCELQSTEIGDTKSSHVTDDSTIVDTADDEGIVNSDEEVSDDDEKELEDDSDEGWITPSNLSEVQKKFGTVSIDENKEIVVACITSDFAIQNILLQMGLNMLSVDGMLIKQMRVFVLRCHACFKLTTNVSKTFCPKCGNKTLKKVAVSYNEDGSRNVHINFRRPINIRGTKYSLPQPRGGKHSQDPILSADQPVPHNRPTKKALQKMDVLSPDYGAMSSPFMVNDVYSRAASLGIKVTKGRSSKRNPNEWSTRTGNKRKSKH